MLRRFARTLEIRIETRRRPSAPVHRTTVWVVTVDGGAFVRSYRGTKGRWYREARENPKVHILAGSRRIAARVVPVTDRATIARVSQAYRSKYGRRWPGETRPMLRRAILSTTLRVLLRDAGSHARSQAGRE